MKVPGNIPRLVGRQRRSFAQHEAPLLGPDLVLEYPGPRATLA